MRRRFPVLVAAIATTTVMAAATSCGPSSTQIKRAKAVRYKTSFATVWNVVSDVLRSEVKQFRVEDAVKGVIETRWRLVEQRTGDPISDPNVGTGKQSGTRNQELAMMPGGVLIRYKARVTGGGPWRVSVEIEAAEYRPGMTMLQPFQRGGPDEPHYVQTRLDRVYVTIYKKLRNYAIVDAVEPVVDEKPIDATPWRELPADASQAVARVHDAAKRRNLDALRALMSTEFTWSLGGEPSVDQAIAMWNADPDALRALARTLHAGCGHDATNDTIACPAGATLDGTGPRAGFRKQGGIWRFSFFVGGR